MEKEIKNIIEQYKNKENYNASICKIKKIIDAEYENIQNEKKEQELKIKMKDFFGNKNINNKILNEFEKIQIKINKKTEENIADYFLDCTFAYDLYYKKKNIYNWT